MSRVFISHSSRDWRAAVALKTWLIQPEAGFTDEQVFLDIDPATGIAPGAMWKPQLGRALARSEAVICLISPDWESSAECLAEYRHAEYLGKRVFCARIDPRARGVKARDWQFCDLHPRGESAESTEIIVADPDVTSSAPVVFATEGLQLLLRGLREAGIGAQNFPWPPPEDPSRAPYRGWQPMSDEDAAVFFGRDAETLRAIDALRGMRGSAAADLFVVLGPSGAGKSSFLRAGILPRLRRDPTHFVVCGIVRPERAAVTGERGLAAAVFELRSGCGLVGPSLGEIKSACRNGDAAQLIKWLGEAQTVANGEESGVGWPDGGGPTIVLPVDQAEELFAPDAGGEAAQFLGLLVQLLHPDDGSAGVAMIVMATIRADHFEALQTAPQIGRLRTREFGDLKPMPTTQFKEVITGPAARATAAGRPLQLSPALTEQLLADATGGADTLPLLALTLSRLYIDYSSTGELTLEHYRSMGGMERIVQSEIDTLLSTDPQERHGELEALRAGFIPCLATVDPHTDQPLRRVARWSELPAASHRLIDAMVARRLLVKDDRNGSTVVEVALESLLRQWDPLAQWLREQSGDLKEADNIERAAADWDRNGRREAWLIDGARLESAEQLAQKPGFRERLEACKDFLLAARQEADAEAEAERARQQDELDTARKHADVLRKRARVLRAVLAVTIVVALVAVYYLFDARRARDAADTRFREATASRLAAEAQAVLAGARTREDVRTIQTTLAAEQVSPSADPSVLLPTLNALSTTEKIIDTGQEVFGVSLRADGRRIVIGGEQAREWDADTGALVGEPITPADMGAYIAEFSPVGDTIATVGHDNSVRLWKSDTHEQIGKPMTAPSPITAIAFNAAGDRLAAVSADNQIHLWDTALQRETTQPVMAGPKINAIAFSPAKPSLLAVAGDSSDDSLDTPDGFVQFWNLDSGALDGEPISAPGPIQSVAFSPDGKQIVTGSIALKAPFLDDPRFNSAMQRWDADSRGPIGNPMRGHTGAVPSLDYDADGDYIASVAVDRTLRIWEAATGEPAFEPLRGHGHEVTGVAFSRAGDRVVTGSIDKTVRVWKLPMSRPSLAKPILEDESTGDGEDGIPVTPTSFAAGIDDRHALLGTYEGDVWMFDPVTKDPDGPPLSGHTTSVDGLAVSPDGRRIGSGSSDGTVRLWDVKSRLPIGNAQSPHEGEVSALKFSRDSHRLVSHSEHTNQVWDAETGSPIGRPIKGCTNYSENSFAISPRGEFVATVCEDKSVRLWNADTGDPIGEPMRRHEFEPRDVAFTPDGEHIVSVSVDSLRLWDTGTQEQIAEQRAQWDDPFTALTVSDDGRYIVTGGLKSLHRWHGATAEPIGTPMSGLEWEHNAVAFTRDGRYIVASDSDSLRFWDADTGTSIGEPLRTPYGGEIWEIVVSPDDRVIYTDEDLAWPGPASWREMLCSKLTANMTPKQWDDWVSEDIPYIRVCEHLDVPPDAPEK